MILVTGSSGFVGGALVKVLASNNQSPKLVVASRRLESNLPSGVKSIMLVDDLSKTDWKLALKGVTAVVHCAGRVHVMNDKSSNPMCDFRRINVEGTVNLARQAAFAGVKRFIFLSSIKVNGESTKLGNPFNEESVAEPKDFYGVSKFEAEKLLREIANQTGMELVIIRPPLVYGPNVRANFESMMYWLVREIPLPLAAITNNRRSLVSLGNLVDLIITCINHPLAANQIFLVSDGEDLSTAELLRRTGVALGRPACLFYVPISLLKIGAAMTNQITIYERLCGSLQIDINKTRQLLGWAPPISVEEGLRRTADGFLR